MKIFSSSLILLLVKVFSILFFFFFAHCLLNEVCMSGGNQLSNCMLFFYFYIYSPKDSPIHILEHNISHIGICVRAYTLYALVAVGCNTHSEKRKKKHSMSIACLYVVSFTSICFLCLNGTCLFVCLSVCLFSDFKVTFLFIFLLF